MWGPQRTEKQSGVLTPWVSNQYNVVPQEKKREREKGKGKRKKKKEKEKEKRGREGERIEACVEIRSPSYPNRIFEEDPTLRRVATPPKQTSRGVVYATQPNGAKVQKPLATSSTRGASGSGVPENVMHNVRKTKGGPAQWLE